MAMRLTNYILELGRVVAYYPGLKKITKSTTATIFLCQFLYWCDKTKDKNGWVYKNHQEIEDETGLTYNEQLTAKKKLVELGLMDIEFKRLDRTSRLRVNQEMLNTLWEQETGKKAESRNVAEPVEEPLPMYPPSEYDILKKAYPKKDTDEKLPEPEVKVEKKEMDVIEKMRGWDSLGQAPRTKADQMRLIKTKMEKKLNILMDDYVWNSFIEFVWNRETKFNEPVDKFLKWATSDEGGFDPVYWNPAKCKTVWPRAFVESEKNKPRADFVEKLPERKEEVYVPYPKELTSKDKYLKD
jgi:hypothetical protein